MNFLGGTFLRWVFGLLLAGILLRLILFAISLGREGKEPEESASGAGFLRSLVPYHRAFAKSPFRAVLGYLFHICLIVVPIGFSGHLALWSDSLFAWAIPDGLADVMCAVVVLFSIFFLGRRIFVKRVRQDSSPSDYVLIVLTGLPYFSGAMLTHVEPGLLGFSRPLRQRVSSHGDLPVRQTVAEGERLHGLRLLRGRVSGPRPEEQGRRRDAGARVHSFPVHRLRDVCGRLSGGRSESAPHARAAEFRSKILGGEDPFRSDGELPGVR